jgi:hypothetical protein
VSRHRATPEGRRAQLLAELAEVLGFALEPGHSCVAKLGDGRVVAELRIDVRRAVTDQELAAFRTFALDRLRQSPWRLQGGCECDTKRKRPFLGGHMPCTRSVQAAVIYRGPGGDQHVVFACDLHAAGGAGCAPASILGTVALRPMELAELRLTTAKAQQGGAA